MLYMGLRPMRVLAGSFPGKIGRAKITGADRSIQACLLRPLWLLVICVPLAESQNGDGQKQEGQQARHQCQRELGGDDDGL